MNMKKLVIEEEGEEKVEEVSVPKPFKCYR